MIYACPEIQATAADLAWLRTHTRMRVEATTRPQSRPSVRAPPHGGVAGICNATAATPVAFERLNEDKWG